MVNIYESVVHVMNSQLCATEYGWHDLKRTVICKTILLEMSIIFEGQFVGKNIFDGDFVGSSVEIFY